MPSKRNTALGVALEQRQRVLDQTRTVLSERDRSVRETRVELSDAESRVGMVLQQMDAAQRPQTGMELPVSDLQGLEILLDWCDCQVAVAQEHLQTANIEAEAARGFVAVAHQQVRALELVLEARAAEVAEIVRRTDLRDQDEVAARVHARSGAMR